MRNVPVSKCLDKKLIIFGYEVADVLAIFLTLSILNFLFGQTSLKFTFVWLPTIVLATVLRVGKRGKPEKYLFHWIRYQFQPGTFCAFKEPTQNQPYRKERSNE